MRNCRLQRTLVALSALVWTLGARPAGAIDRPVPPKAAAEVEVTLIPTAAGSGPEVVSFGLPLPPQALSDAGLVRVVDERGTELSAAVRSLEPWRIDGREGTIRSLLIQFPMQFESSKTRKVRVLFGKAPASVRKQFVPVADTLIEPDGLKGPRVLALLPAKWLTDSWVAGPQVPAAESGPYAAYEAYIEKNFPGSLKFLDSETFDHWLFDKTACYYKMYVRTGDRKFLEAAYHTAHFVRLHTRMDGPAAGVFTLKGEYDDLKYVYPRAMHLHYLLTGDDRALQAGKIMAKYALDNWDPVYRPKIEAAGGADAKAERVFWTERHTGYGFLGVIHGWELTGDRVYWDKAKVYADALYKHQTQPPDGRPGDGSFRRYGRSDKGFRGTSSAWMTSILIDPIFNYWMLTGDARIPGMVVAWCDFLDKNGIRPDGRQAFYMIRSPQSDPGTAPSDPGPDMELHHTEMAYMFAMGIFFSEDPARTGAYRKRFDTLFPLAMAVDHFKALDHRKLQGREVEPSVRSFNWATQASSQLVFFMQHPGGKAR